MAALGALATVVFSLVPALQASRAARRRAVLQRHARVDGVGRGRQWMRSLLAGAQVALTLALLVAAALIVGAVQPRGRRRDRASTSAQLITAQLTLPEGPYADRQRRRAFVATVLERAAGRAAGAPPRPRSAPCPTHQSRRSRTLPARGTAGRRPAPSAAGRPACATTPDYFDALRIPLMAGRALSDGDGADAPRGGAREPAAGRALLAGRGSDRPALPARQGRRVDHRGRCRRRRRPGLVRRPAAARRSIVPLAQDPTLEHDLRGAHRRRSRGSWPTPCGRP